MRNLVCRICLSTRLEVALVLENSPRNIQRLLPSRDFSLDQAITLHVYCCVDCGHVQLCDELDDDYYDDYLMTASHSAQMQAYQAQQARDFVTELGLRGKRIIEFGCGDGNFMLHLREAGAQVVGVEPSARFRKLAQARGLEVFPSYVGRNMTLSGAPYDAFVTREVLEHVPSPNDFMEGMRINVAKNAPGLIQVPSLEQTLAQKRFYDFFPDHLSYYSARALSSLAIRNSFKVLSVSRGMNGEYNVAWVQRTTDNCSQLEKGTWQEEDTQVSEYVSKLESLSQEILDLKANLQAFVKRRAERNERVAVWGAGGKGIAVLAVTQLTGIAYVIDSDPNKQGRWTPVSDLPVVSPTALLAEPVDALIVTAMAYKDEIVHHLREEIAFKGEIVCLTDRLTVVT